MSVVAAAAATAVLHLAAAAAAAAGGGGGNPLELPGRMPDGPLCFFFDIVCNQKSVQMPKLRSPKGT